MVESRRGRERRSFRVAIRDHAPSSEPKGELTQRYLNSGYYFEPVHRLIEGLGRHRVLVVLFEELLAEPDEVLYSVAMFLGIEPDLVDLRRWPRVQGEEPPATGLLARLLPWRGQPPDTGPAARLRDLYRSDITALERYLFRDLQVLRGRV